MNNNLSLGLIDTAFMRGSHDPAMYLRKYPRASWTQRGGYEIQTTPQEVAAVISHIRSYLRGNRMLCVGSETLGAERFIAEKTAILDIDYIGTALVQNITGLTDSKIKVEKVEAPRGDYDVVTVFGGLENLEQIEQHVKIGTFIVFLGTGTVNGKPLALRAAWMAARKKYMAILQTGSLPYETGVGIVKVLFVPPNKVVVSTMQMPKDEKPEEESFDSDGGKDGNQEDNPAEAPKRRGRPPGVKDA